MFYLQSLKLNSKRLSGLDAVPPQTPDLADLGIYPLHMRELNSRSFPLVSSEGLWQERITEERIRENVREGVC